MKHPGDNGSADIEELKHRLAEAEQLIEAIKAGEVDAFAISKNNKSEVFTLESGDYAYRVLVENFSEGALNLSEDGLIVYTNNYLHDLLQLPYDKVISHYIFDFIHSSSEENFKQLFNRSLRGRSKGEINLVCENRIIPVYISLTSLQPTLATVGMIVTDLTEKKKQEQMMERKNRELEMMNKELQSFAYISSHDLQEPLRKIQTFATRLADKEKDSLSDYGKDSLHRMLEAARRMQKLIEDLLLYSRTNTEERKFEQTDLQVIIDKVKKDLGEDLKDKKATIESNILCRANVIPFQFIQLLHNLIGNSLKFSKAETPLVITINSETVKGGDGIEKLLSDKNYCHITITDNGIGFDQQYSEKIFEVFHRLHGKSEYKGTGIGLSIVKKIVENHHGFIKAEGTLGKGATFHIYIPE